MSNIEVTNNNTTGVAIWDPVFEGDTLTFTGAGTYAAGTLLARDSSTLKLIAFVKGGTTNENGIPKVVLTYDVTATAAGDVAIRPAVSGRLRASSLVIAADGDASNVDAAVLDQLRGYGLVALATSELSELDNQ